jgi:hypothetical protein
VAEKEKDKQREPKPPPPPQKRPKYVKPERYKLHDQEPKERRRRR